MTLQNARAKAEWWWLSYGLAGAASSILVRSKFEVPIGVASLGSFFELLAKMTLFCKVSMRGYVPYALPIIALISVTVGGLMMADSFGQVVTKSVGRLSAVRGKINAV